MVKEAASAALPLESDLHDDDSTVMLDELPKSKSKHSVSSFDRQVAQPQQLTQPQEHGVDVEQDYHDRPQQASLDQLKRDLRVEIKEEWKEQLEAQKRLADEQLEAQKSLMDEQLEAQKKLSDEQLEAQKKQADERFEQVQAQLGEMLAIMRAGVRT